jgi:hypothetical protein
MPFEQTCFRPLGLQADAAFRGLYRDRLLSPDFSSEAWPTLGVCGFGTKGRADVDLTWRFDNRLPHGSSQGRA